MLLISCSVRPCRACKSGQTSHFQATSCLIPSCFRFGEKDICRDSVFACTQRPLDALAKGPQFPVGGTYLQIEEDGSQRPSPLEVVQDGPPGGGHDQKRADDVCRGEGR